MAEKIDSPEDLAVQWMVQGLITFGAGLVAYILFPRRERPN